MINQIWSVDWQNVGVHVRIYMCTCMYMYMYLFPLPPANCPVIKIEIVIGCDAMIRVPKP